MGKIKSSAYWWFMRHLQEVEYKKTGRVISMGQLCGSAKPKWEKMSDQERKPYNDKHKEYQAGPRPPLFDFAGELAAKRNSNQNGQSNQPAIKQEPGPSGIKPESRSESVSSVTSVVDPDRQSHVLKALAKYIDEASDEELISKKFYIVASNVMCGTRKELPDFATEDRYYPLELGIVEFSIQSGLGYEFNKFIDPGPIPSGMSRICYEHEKLHEIPLAGFSMAIGCNIDPDTNEYNQEERRKNFDDLCCDLDEILRLTEIPEVHLENEPPVRMFFSKPDQTFQNKGVLLAIAEEAGYDDAFEAVEVLNIHELFFYLCRKKGYKLKQMLLDIIESHTYDHDGKCDYHDAKETIYCAKGVAARFAWLMSAKLCELYGVEMKKSHKPDKNDYIEGFDSFISWDTKPRAGGQGRKRYFDENIEKPKRSYTVNSNITFPPSESIGRGRFPARNVNEVKNESIRFPATDVRTRQPPQTTEEPKPGQSSASDDILPKLPNSPNDPRFRSSNTPAPVSKPSESIVGNSNSPGVAPKQEDKRSTPTQITIGRGRARVRPKD